MRQTTILTGILLAMMLCLVSCGSNAQREEAKKIEIEIPRTHCGISLGDTRAMVQKVLSGMDVERKTDDSNATDLTYVLFKSIDKEDDEKQLNKDVKWECIHLKNNNEYYSISIYWYADKVAAIKTNPYNDETIVESVREKYPLDGCGGYNYGTLGGVEFERYDNEKTSIVVEKNTNNVKINVGYGLNISTYDISDNPEISYEFIYLDRSLIAERTQTRESEKQRMESLHRQEVENLKAKY